MCSPIVAELTETLLAEYRANQLGVSFAGKVLKWNTGDDVMDLVEAINNCPTLKYLELEGNTLGVNAAIEIGKALENKPEFEVALWKDLFTGRLKNEIPQAMKYLFSGVDLAGARLQYLDLSDNAIGPLGMVGLAPFFKSTSSFSIKTLICQNNGLGPEGAKEFSKALISCRELSIQKGGEVFSLKKLMCGRNRMQNAGALAMSRFIQVCDSLEELHMPENSISGAAHQELAKGLANNPKLRVVNFNDNTINGKGLDALVDVVGTLTNLEDLNLGDCLLKSQGAMLLVTALRDLPQLRSLVLEGNEINASAGIRIAEMLESHRNLQTVNLDANGFGFEGLSVIRSKLSNIPNLSTEECEEEADEEEEEEGDGEEGSDEDDEDEDEEDGEIHSDDEEDDYSDVDEIMDRILTFVNEPTLEAYKSIPAPGLAEYVYDIPNDDGHPFEIFINGAVGILEDAASKGNVSFEAKSVFLELMGEAANLGEGMNEQFSSALLESLGLRKNRDNEYTRNKISVPLLQCLSVWLIKDDQHKNTDLLDNTISVLKKEFANARPGLEVDRPKLTTLVDYVIIKRRGLNAAK